MAVILCISPSQEVRSFGFIYLSIDKLKYQAAIIAYLDNVGREAAILPCHNFDEFLASNSLQTCQVSFINNLPAYIVFMGQYILKENAYSEEMGPDLSWLTRSPSMTSPLLLS